MTNLNSSGMTFTFEKGEGYFYFWKGDANNWLDRTVNVPKVSSLTLDKWVGEFNRIEKLNRDVLSVKALGRKTKQPKRIHK